MKVRVLLSAALLCLLLLCACGRAEEETPAAPEASPDFVSVELRSLPTLSLEESRAMARFLCANRALLLDGRLYCFDFDESWQPVLASYRWDGKTLDDFSILAAGCVPEYLCAMGDRLFYLDRSTGALEAVPMSGGERKLLREGPCAWLSQREELLYFCDGEGRFLSLDPDSGAETELLAGPCSFAYPLEGAILYRAEDGRLHLTWTDDGEDLLLSSGPASSPLLLGDRLYYDTGAGLYRVGLDGLGAELLALPAADGPVELLPLAEGLTVRGIRDENGPVQWAGPPEGPFQHQGRGYRICDWLGGGVQVDTVYEPDGRIRCFVLTDEKGRALSYLAGSTA